MSGGGPEETSEVVVGALPVFAYGRRPSGERSARSFTIRRGRRGPQKEHALAVLVPRYSIAASHDPVDFDGAFGRPGPLIVDIGFGSGATTLSLAERHPDANVVGIETHENGLAILAHELDTRRIENVRVVTADAFDVVDLMVPKLRAQIIQLVCPDPWPKASQAHRRLFNATFARMCAERLAVGGELRLATDWAPYAEQMLEVCSSEALLTNAAVTDDGYTPPHPDRPVTVYERKGLAAGRTMRDLLFRRV